MPRPVLPATAGAPRRRRQFPWQSANAVRSPIAPDLHRRPWLGRALDGGEVSQVVGHRLRGGGDILGKSVRQLVEAGSAGGRERIELRCIGTTHEETSPARFPNQIRLGNLKLALRWSRLICPWL